MTNQFDGKTAFVTGATSGIGRATALAFAEQGANVTVADISADRCRETAQMIEQRGGHALALTCDVTKADDVRVALQRTVDAFGRLDVAFNNAGIEQVITPAAEIAEEDWIRTIDVNLRGIFLCMKYEIPLMWATGGGAIVNTSSGAGVMGIAGQAAYAASKHGVIGLTKSAALDYAAAGVRINAVCPGIIDTPMMQRFSGGTEEGRQRVIDQEPIGRTGRPRRSPRQSVAGVGSGRVHHWRRRSVVDGGQTVG